MSKLFRMAYVSTASKLFNSAELRDMLKESNVRNKEAGITGKFVAAPYDGWRDWPDHLAELNDSDIFTLRRIVPGDRGMDWQ